MHLIIAFLTALASVLYALERLGIDIGWFNPWSWKRRRRWLKQLHANPAFNLDSPMESLALLLVATAKIDGDLTSEEKQALKAMFEDTFNQSSEDASALLRSSSFLLGSGEAVFSKPQEVLARSQSKFSGEQKTSALDMLKRISEVGGPPSETQKDYIARIESLLVQPRQQEGWK